MTTLQLLITGLISLLATLFVRFSPFILFPDGKKVPGFITWLGGKLPRATMAMLVIYCLKDVSFAAIPGWVPTLVGVAVTAALHVWKKQMVISIVGGTAVYMILLRLIG